MEVSRKRITHYDFGSKRNTRKRNRETQIKNSVDTPGKSKMMPTYKPSRSDFLRGNHQNGPIQKEKSVGGGSSKVQKETGQKSPGTAKRRLLTPSTETGLQIDSAKRGKRGKDYTKRARARRFQRLGVGYTGAVPLSLWRRRGRRSYRRSKVGKHVNWVKTRVAITCQSMSKQLHLSKRREAKVGTKPWSVLGKENHCL